MEDSCSCCLNLPLSPVSSWLPGDIPGVQLRSRVRGHLMGEIGILVAPLSYKKSVPTFEQTLAANSYQTSIKPERRSGTDDIVFMMSCNYNVIIYTIHYYFIIHRDLCSQSWGGQVSSLYEWSYVMSIVYCWSPRIVLKQVLFGDFCHLIAVNGSRGSRKYLYCTEQYKWYR